MHYFVHRDLRLSPLIRRQLLIYLTMILLYLFMMPFLQRQQLGIFPSEIRDRLFGNEATFLSAKPIVDVATQVHIQLFFDSLVALLVGAVLLRANLHAALIRWASLMLFTLPLIRALAVALTLYFSPAATWLVAASFWLNWCLQFSGVAISLLYLGRRPQSAPSPH